MWGLSKAIPLSRLFSPFMEINLILDLYPILLYCRSQDLFLLDKFRFWMFNGFQLRKPGLPLRPKPGGRAAKTTKRGSIIPVLP